MSIANRALCITTRGPGTNGSLCTWAQIRGGGGGGQGDVSPPPPHIFEGGGHKYQMSPPPPPPSRFLGWMIIHLYNDPFYMVHVCDVVDPFFFFFLFFFFACQKGLSCRMGTPYSVSKKFTHQLFWDLRDFRGWRQSGKKNVCVPHNPLRIGAHDCVHPQIMAAPR